MILSKKISKSITSELYKNKIIDDTNKEYYSYCFDYIIENIIYYLSLIVIGCFSAHLIPALLYIMIMMPLKMLAGGAHAKSPGSCTVISYSVYIFSLFLSDILSLSTFTMIIAFFISCICISILSPVEHPNKRFNAEKRIKLKRACRFFLMLVCFLFVIMIKLNKVLYSNIILICVMIVTINQIIGKILYRSEATEYGT